MAHDAGVVQIMAVEFHDRPGQKTAAAHARQCLGMADAAARVPHDERDEQGVIGFSHHMEMIALVKSDGEAMKRHAFILRAD